MFINWVYYYYYCGWNSYLDKTYTVWLVWFNMDLLWWYNHEYAVINELIFSLQDVSGVQNSNFFWNVPIMMLSQMWVIIIFTIWARSCGTSISIDQLSSITWTDLILILTAYLIILPILINFFKNVFKLIKIKIATIN